jgi:hypothetical protein
MNAEMHIEPVRRKVVWGSRIRLAVALAGAVLLIVGALLLTSCSQMIRTGQSPSYLIMNTLTAAPGTSTTFSAVLHSDVLNVDPTTGAQSIAVDLGQADLKLALKDDPLGSSPSAVNSITITQYHVEYVRSDGRNTQGVDVPFAFDGGVTVTVADLATVPFTLVRSQAKEEAPLKALAFGGGAIAITTIARVTFYGHDQNGRDVSVTGNIEVTFSDWAG